MWQVCHEDLGSTRGAAYILYFPTLPGSLNSVAITPVYSLGRNTSACPRNAMSKMLPRPFSAMRFSAFSRALCKQPPPISHVAFCILSTSCESDEKYTACLPLFHCELSGIKAAQNAVKCILEQHGQESLDSVEYQNRLQFLIPGGFQYWEIILLTPSELNSPLCAIHSWTHVILLRPHTRWSIRIFCDITDPRDDSNSIVCILSPPTIII